jgi:hypothetical protein
MAIIRKSPIPRGRYWADVVQNQKFPNALMEFDLWLYRNAGNVSIVNKETFGALWNGIAHNWYLFDVKLPVEWPKDKGFGFPNVAQSPENPKAPRVETYADTSTIPEPEGVFDQFQDFLNSSKSLIVIGIAIYAFAQLAGKRK